MDIVLIHLGEGVPGYMFDCVKQIRKFTKDRIICAFSYAPSFHFDCGDDIMLMNLENLPKSAKYEKFLEMDFFKTWGDNPLWRYSCERFYALETIMDTLGIDSCLHLENDNLIYAEPDEKLFKDLCFDDIGVTAITPTLYGAGVMYVGSRQSLNMLTVNLNALMSLGMTDLTKRYGSEMMNEMRMLQICTLDEDPICRYSPLTLMPNVPDPKSKYVYDCASWGQYVGGTHADPDIQYTTNAHIVGKMLNERKYGVRWHDGLPFVFDKETDEEKQLFNLHIHSKNLAKWSNHGN